ncbi:unnamed protein product [Candidula unifasciata]|uniref:G-protein coupled receptors family 1 profile domain-containing protein n=1 Tax=Candidula unifasciata TaxID=100452 RepID=A0A8S3ZGN3_9EUPU|nr:unnamed protein product [Candidula unifasciata]
MESTSKVMSVLTTTDKKVLDTSSHYSLSIDTNNSDDIFVDQNTYTDDPDPVSYEALYYFMLINMWGGGLPVSIFGVLTNLLNIFTFLKQGVQDTVNISLLALAISDLCSQIPLTFASIFIIPTFNMLDLPFACDDLLYLLVWIHVMFTRVTTLITAYITLERCICVAAPLKVKNIFSPARTLVCMVTVFAVMLALVSPMLYTARLTWIFSPLRNATILGVTFIDNRNKIETITFASSNLIPTVAFFLVIVCTVLLVVNLQKKSQWRLQASVSSSSSVMSSRDRKVVKMVTLISVIFVVCYFPGTAGFIWLIVDTEMRFDGKHRNLLYAVYSVLFNLESINASINLFIYLRLSSKFRSTFLKAFCRTGKSVTSSKTTKEELVSK